MLWFKHRCDSSQDQKLMLLEERFGLEGYGAYWKLLEIIGSQMKPENQQTFVKLSAKSWRKFLGFPPKKLKNFATFSEKVGLFIVKIEGDDFTFDCPNMLKIKDEYSSRSKSKEKKYRDSVGSLSGQYPEPYKEKEKEKEKERKGEPAGSFEPEGSDSSFPSQPKETQTKPPKPRAPPCPHLEIVAIYNKIFHPELSRIMPSMWSDGSKRKKNLAARWKQDAKYQKVEFWEYYFNRINSSNKLMNRNPTKRFDFVPHIEWMLRREIFERVMEKERL